MLGLKNFKKRSIHSQVDEALSLKSTSLEELKDKHLHSESVKLTFSYSCSLKEGASLSVAPCILFRIDADDVSARMRQKLDNSDERNFFASHFSGETEFLPLSLISISRDFSRSYEPPR